MKKHIVIDARLYGPQHTGIGRYTKNLLLELKNLVQFSDFKFTLLVYPELIDEIRFDLGTTFSYFATSIRHYSLSEQILLPILLLSLKPDLVHFTHFNKPILFWGKSVITIHDLIKHFYKGRETTTKNLFLYWPKYIAYRLISHINIKTAHHLIVPSNFWKQILIDTFHLKPSSVTTTYEAVDPKFIINQKPHFQSDSDYIIYTGNLYPHKNVDIILHALKKIPDINLKIICARNVFSQRLKQKVASQNLQKRVQFLGYIPDTDFKNTYAQALALVHPSFMEGFSLTGLEAMALGCPVISSNSSCLPEIYGDSVIYFDPHDVNQLVDSINQLKKSSTLRKKLINLGLKQLKKYSWKNTADLTFKIYSDSLHA